jgi:hypothetical protein
MPPEALVIGVGRPHGRDRLAGASTVDRSVGAIHQVPASDVAHKAIDSGHPVALKARGVVR